MKLSHQNHGLFSDHYLNESLPKHPIWQINVEKIFSKIKEIYESKKHDLPYLNEPQLEEYYIRPLFTALGHIYEVQPPLAKTIEGLKTPDYAFFGSEDLKLKARRTPGDQAFFEKAIGLAEVKCWGRPLDRKSKAEVDLFEAQNPSQQISRYLWLTEIKWGILTDGRYFRLYERETSKRLNTYYQVDLPQMLEQEDIEGFKYFFLFFQKEAFPEFLNQVYQESLDYAEGVGEELKENVYKALKLLAEGFLKNPENRLDVTNISDIHHNSLIFLYRLLFVLYAEARGLLPLRENPLYAGTFSLASIKKEVKQKIDFDIIPPNSTFYFWSKLTQLFKIIARGNQELGVPPYNGGLFEPRKHPFLEKNRVGDGYFCQVIDLLARSGRAFVDYGSLKIRHLGSIYEGLLEYRLKVADSDMASVREKGREFYLGLEEAREDKKRFLKTDIVKAGEIYLITDKGERKATGSYYTPEYVVDYIVENTIRPLCDGITSKIRSEINKLEEQIKGSRGANREHYQKQLEAVKTSFDDEILKLKILDPAMGSGHFLVRATEYLAEEIATNPYAWDEEISEDALAVDFWKRRVVEHCIFGVDLNPLAVELAKLSLWLSTVAKGKPLSFLDHHLKIGNSLISAKLERLQTPPIIKGKEKRPEVTMESSVPFDEADLRQDIGLSVRDYLLIEQMRTESPEDVENKSNILDNLNRMRLDQWREIANLWTSAYFGIKLYSKPYQQLCSSIRTKGPPGKWSEKYFKQVQAINREKHFFHWELEFPEVFFDKFGRLNDNPGFDVVIGNPPYHVLSARERKEGEDFIQPLLTYFRNNYGAMGGKLNLYRLMIEQGHRILRESGYFGFIVPNTILADQNSAPLRKLLFESSTDMKYLEFPEKARVFPQVTQAVCITLFKKSNKEITKIDLAAGLAGEKDLKEPKFSTIAFDEVKKLHERLLPIPIATPSAFQVLRNLLKFPKWRDIKELAIFQGEVNLTNYRKCLSSTEGAPLIRGEHIGRYEIIIDPKEVKSFVDEETYLARAGTSQKARHHKSVRIAFQEVANMQLEQRLNGTIVEPGIYLSHTANYVMGHNKYSVYFLLALFNSTFLNWRFRLTSTTNHVSGGEVRHLPFPPVSFTTSKIERGRFGKKGEALYKPYLLTKQYDPIFQFIDQRLFAQPEQSDVIHDFLAFLSEQMIEMNKEKQSEIRGFLEWLEGLMGMKVDQLKNKTKIRGYFKSSWEDFLGALKRNKGKIKKMDITRREPQEKIRAEYEASQAKLLPLLSKIKSMDNLINQIVYKLYGLTEEEIKIVEEMYR